MPVDSLPSPDDISAQLAASDNPLATLRALRDKTLTGLNERFLAGDPISRLLRARAEFVDRLLIAIWDWCELPADNAMSLIAVGGYGRAELHPHSDIDLLVLVTDDSAEKNQEKLEKFITTLWDIKLDIGHSVRNHEQCVEEAAADITVATNLMESRLLLGNSDMHQRLSEATGPDAIWSNRDFYRAKWDEQFGRHRKYANTEYNLEPNVKGNPGGLRDVQTIGWIAKRYLQTDDIKQLVEQGILTEEEFDVMISGQDYLWRVRWALHMVSGREEDRLLFEHQQKLAEIFGYQSSEANLAVEQFMQQFYRWVMALSALNDLVMQLFEEVILADGNDDVIRPINERFQVKNNSIQPINANLFEERPASIMEIFVLMAQDDTIIGPRANTIRGLRAAQRHMDDSFRRDPLVNQYFMQLLQSPHKIATQLLRMNRYGLLGKYLPEFERIVGQMQHDLFHIYTVDAHTIQVVKNMRLFRHEEFRDKFPIAANIVKRLPKIELLYIAGLYHDIAKGRGGDHSELGCADAAEFCATHGINVRDTNLVVWLVKNHLVMSSTSQRKDISDPEVIREFALLMGDQLHLDYLFALTVADINATNPTLWTSWRASLMRQLYLETKRALRRGLENTIDKQEWIDENKETAIRLMEDDGYDADEILDLWESRHDDYFLRESPTDIGWHSRAFIDNPEHEGAVVLVKDTTHREGEGASQVFIHTESLPNLFNIVTTAFEQLNLTIQDARIYDPMGGHSMDTYIVLESDDQPIGNNQARISEIQAKLTNALADPSSLEQTTPKHVPRQLKHFDYPTEVHMDTDSAGERTAMEIITPDRPGLLARIGRVFRDHNIHLKNAKITTLGERVEDVFFITDAEGRAIEDDAAKASLAKAMCEALDQKESCEAQ